MRHLIRLKRTFAGALASIILIFSISVAHIAPIGIVTGVTAVAVTQMACGPDTLSKLHDTLNKTAKSFEAAVDTNGRLYAGGIYGATGSPEAIAIRKKVATFIHDGNEHLITALQLAKGLTKETFEAGKLAVLEALSRSAAALGSTGNRTMDLVLQATAALINNAVVLIQAFTAGVVDQLPKALQTIDEHIRTFENIAEEAL